MAERNEIMLAIFITAIQFAPIWCTQRKASDLYAEEHIAAGTSEIDIRELQPQLQLHQAKARRWLRAQLQSRKANTMRRNRAYASG